ncbi:MAG: 4-demethylwyosine synthase TYW1 [Methanothrix sp.]|jgi:tRNA wybutosine-synthesizing protein 1|nr:MAG: wyosine biosynthesis protein TYW1 [Methanosaeta sp. SDB]MCP1392587.1 4-demethylwyosine synthase TYW1 [Methanothrix harundinacea]MDD3709434.1 4-demethylwyosine synthase TYW1 [Methanothrix sp.]MDD5767990.1 4-demethylwyosine synthase TYW1 [Methanothrix sp.]MDI9398834.1 4-demethylwyosine synthase TYW1 [Euryarchaeota archaeon]
MERFPPQISERLKRQGYHMVAHGAVKPCLWLRRSIRGGDQCYKNHFYGIASHRCVQMTPTLLCNHRCLHCWRPIDDMPNSSGDWIEPAELLDGILEEQQRLISGYGGAPETTDLSRLEEAKHPAHVAVSLMGEPTLYPMIKELVDEIKSRDMTAFLVTNGTMPDVIGEVRPTQLYLSLNAPDEETYLKVSNPQANLWSRFLESLDRIRESPSRTVMRLTLARNLNMIDPQGYAKLIEIAEPDFVELKAYMHLGSSRNRLERDSMPTHEEVMEFAGALSEILGYRLQNHVPLSRVALLSRGSAQERIEL